MNGTYGIQTTNINIKTYLSLIEHFAKSPAYFVLNSRQQRSAKHLLCDGGLSVGTHVLRYSRRRCNTQTDFSQARTNNTDAKLHFKFLLNPPSFPGLLHISQEQTFWIHAAALFKVERGGHEVGEKNFHEFSKSFQSHNYTFSELTATKILAIWQHLGRILAIFSPRMHRNGYFS